MRNVFVALAAALIVVAPAHAITEPWSPLIVQWQCAAQLNNEYKCSLFSWGLAPTTLGTSIEATGSYRVLKGPNAGIGFPLITNTFTAPCTLAQPYIQCVATDIVTLAVGITPVIDSAIISTDLNIYSATPGHLFDWDGDGLITADREGLMLTRFLLGFRGAAVTNGVPLAPGRTVDSVNWAVYNGIMAGWFQFIAPLQTPTATREALVFQRCVLGLRGSALVAGIPQTNFADANARCDALLAVE